MAAASGTDPAARSRSTSRRRSSRRSPYKPTEGCGPERLRPGGGWDAERSSRGASVTRRATVARGRRGTGAASAPSGARDPLAPRSGCSARCSARSSRSRRGRSCSRSSSGSAGGRSPSARDDDPARARPPRRRAARPRPRLGRGRHRRVRALLRAGQPGRGARPRPGAPPSRAGRARRRPRRLGRRRDRRLRRLGRTDAELLERDRPPGDLAGPDRPPDRGAPPDGARRAPPLRGAARAARRPAADAVGGSRGAPPPARGDHAAVADLGPAARRRRPRSTRSGRPWRSSTPRCSRWRPASTGRSTRRSTRSPARAHGPASDTGRTGTRPPRVRPFLHWGSWIGGDRDGHPGVTAEITEKTLRIQADHVLRGYEAVATRLMQTIAAATSADRVSRRARLAPRPRRRGPARDRSAAPAPLPGRAVPAALRVHRRAAAPDAGGADRRAGAADRALRAAPPISMPSWSRSRRRSSPTGWAGWPGARSPSCAGSSGRSASTSPRSRSASTPRSTPAALAAIRAGRRRSTELAPGVTLGEVLDDVPGDRRGPGTPRRRRLPPLRRQLHGVGGRRGRRPRARPARHGGGRATTPPS